MRRLFHLAATLTLLTSIGAAHAQIINPDKLVAPPPRNPAEAHSHFTNRPSNHEWMWQYARPKPTGDKTALLADARFTDLLGADLRAPQSMWGIGVPLPEAARTFLAGEGTVSSADNRHLLITGCVVEHCAQRGLLWLDLGAAQPITVFSALRWTEQTRATDQPGAPFDLWIFPSRELDAAHLPGALKTALATWANTAPCSTTIAHVLVVEPNGIPHILGALEAGVPPVCAPPSSLPTGTPQ